MPLKDVFLALLDPVVHHPAAGDLGGEIGNWLWQEVAVLVGGPNSEYATVKKNAGYF